ncbi:unnamed protein product, partial [Allacma fusca]
MKIILVLTCFIAVSKGYLGAFTDRILLNHKFARMIHQAKNLEYNDTLADIAQICADRNAAENVNYNNCPGPQVYGINSCVCNRNEVCRAFAVAVDFCYDSWYNEMLDYNFDIEQNDLERTRHFTQLVWKSSQQ